ncbi:MAG TPA: hypothetical protein VMV78_15005 [Thiobacillus sp.]|jgi:hypothetical protein|nr:hypothetical protein [Thiobacillus sp.]
MRLAICLLALLCAPALAAPPAPIKSRPLAELAIHPVREASSSCWACWWTTQWSSLRPSITASRAAHRRSRAVGTGGGIHHHHRRIYAIDADARNHRQVMLLVPLVVTLTLPMSLAEAYWIMPAHVVGLGGKSLVRGPMAASLA